MIPYCLIDSARLSITEIWNTTSELRLTIFIAMSLLVLYSVDLICRKLIVPSVERISKRTKSKWDDILFSRNVLTDISRVITPLVMLAALPHMFDKTGDIFF
ncbi:MAG: hypothetical protein J6U62_05125, partial [Bacteroidaceae bacterium]|nr:hypothetical protein [Bacteroidaceae bacterium]